MADKVDEVPFRITFYYHNGDKDEFPLFLDALRRDMKDHAFNKEAPFGPTVLEHLDDRELLQWAAARLFASLVRREKGTFYMTDDDGAFWGVIAPSVRAVKVVDPRAKKGRKAPLGFTHSDDS